MMYVDNMMSMVGAEKRKNILDQKLTWRPHITAKKTQINLKLDR